MASQSPENMLQIRMLLLRDSYKFNHLKDDYEDNQNLHDQTSGKSMWNSAVQSWGEFGFNALFGQEEDVVTTLTARQPLYKPSYSQVNPYTKDLN